MLLKSYKIAEVLICCLILFSISDKSVKAEQFSPEKDSIKGYNDIVNFRNKFFAVGTDGRIDCISGSGEKTLADSSFKGKLNCVFSNSEIMIAAGESGMIIYSSDGKLFYHAKSAVNKDIYGIASKNKLIIAGSEKGVLLSSRDGKLWNIIQSGAKGNILSISANSTIFIGITDSGEILKSHDGINWDIKDYNKEYAGYNKYMKFKKILAVQNSIMIIGTHDDGTPAIIFSSLGNVWAERIPIYQDDQGTDCFLANSPNGISYDFKRDQFIIACDDGVLFSLPSCSKCNEYKKISDVNLNAVISAESSLIIVGDKFSAFIQKGME